MKIWLFLALLLGCTTPGEEEKKETTFFKRDISIEFEGKKYSGTAVLPKRSSYEVKIVSAGKLDLFTWSDCHMEHTQEDAGEGGIFSRKDTVVFNYRRDFALSTYCPVEVGGFEAMKGRHSWGFIDFESEEETLPAKVYCNGYVFESKGVSVCQSAKGKLQKIVFSVPVSTVVDDDKCPMRISSDSKTFEFPLSRGYCAYPFKEINGDRFHRLTTLGYDKIQIREVRE
jgi:hypothetical protein